MTKNLAKYHTELEAKVALLEETITSMQNVILNLTSRIQVLESYHTQEAGAAEEEVIGDGPDLDELDDDFESGDNGNQTGEISGNDLIGGDSGDIIWG